MKILSKPKGNAEEYGRWSVNPYIGCSNGCTYCYLKSGPSGKYLGQNKPVLKKGIVDENHAYHLAMAEIIENAEQIRKDGGVFMSFVTDPMLEECQRLSYRIAAECVKYEIPVTFLTKRAGICVDSAIIEKYHNLVNLDNTLVAYGFTLTGHDELEPNANDNRARIATMRALRRVTDFHVWASIEPIIDFPSSSRMIQQALNAGCEHFKIGLMTKNTKVCRDKYDVSECLSFIQDVMVATKDKATVYWKQSVRDFLGGTPTHRRFSDNELHKILDDYPHAVSKNWSIFTQSNLHTED